MAQHDYVIANGTGAAVRSDLNNALAAIVSQNSGATEPATMYAYQWWADTTTGLLKIRNGANNAWITLRELDGTLTIEDGTASAPGLAFADDLNTGIFSPAADQIAFTAGGTARLTATTTAVTSALPVDVPLGSASAPTVTFTGDLNTGIYSPGADQVAVTTNDVERVEWGTSEVVFNDGGENYDFRIEGDTNSSLFFVDASADTVEINGDVTITDKIIHSGDTNTAIRFPAADTVSVETDGSEKCRVDDSGRLLVGTSSSTANAIAVFLGRSSAPGGTGGVVKFAHPTTNVPASATLGLIQFGNTSDDRGAEIAAIANQTWTSTAKGSNLTFSTTADGASSPTEAVRITQAGLVLIGDQRNPIGRGLYVTSNSTNNNEGTFYAYNQNTTAAACIAAFATGTNSTATSNVLIKFGINNYASGSGQINANGSNAAAFGSFSDSRLKENVEDLPSQWNNIKSLRPVEFDYIESAGGGHQIGFIAQEMQTVYPDAVGVGEDEMLTITAWSKTEARLVKALQEAIAKIETLEAKVAALESA